MGQGIRGGTAAALGMIFLGHPPAIAMDRVAIEQEAGGVMGAPGVASNTGSCPTRFDYLVLASLADAPGLLSLSTYHFRSEAGFSTIPLTGLLQVDYRVESVADDCRSRAIGPQSS
jgi:hypothetical protein